MALFLERLDLALLGSSRTEKKEGGDWRMGGMGYMGRGELGEGKSFGM